MAPLVLQQPALKKLVNRLAAGYQLLELFVACEGVGRRRLGIDVDHQNWTEPADGQGLSDAHDSCGLTDAAIHIHDSKDMRGHSIRSLRARF